MHKYLHMALMVLGIYFVIGALVFAYNGFTSNSWNIASIWSWPTYIV